MTEPRRRTVLVMGGRARKNAARLKEWHQFEAALAVRVDLDSGDAVPVLEYISPPDTCADARPSILFKAGSVVEDVLLACTETEVIAFRATDFSRIRHLSLPSFNDVHHVAPGQGGSVLVCSTGVNLVQEVAADGTVNREWDALLEEPWTGYDRGTDYRKVPSTKPHPCHPNYVFTVGGDIWVTRFVQRDAVCLTDPERRMRVSDEVGIHDGIVRDDGVWFTAVDGRLIRCPHDGGAADEVVDLRELHDTDWALGWCRGLAFLDDEHALVGFTRLRPTRARENVRWLQHKLGLRDHVGISPSRIGLYNVRTRTHVRDYLLEEAGMAAVFSVHPLEDGAREKPG